LLFTTADQHGVVFAVVVVY